jgi:hypothetical protein
LIKDGAEHGGKQEGGGGSKTVGKKVPGRLLPLSSNEETKLREPGRMMLSCAGVAGVQGGEEEVGFQRLAFRGRGGRGGRGGGKGGGDDGTSGV